LGIGAAHKIITFVLEFSANKEYMQPKTRIDAPSALHHIIVRGIERRRIFSDNPDRDNIIERLGDIVIETKTFCFD
jgi:hypothetical protein